MDSQLDDAPVAEAEALIRNDKLLPVLRWACENGHINSARRLYARLEAADARRFAEAKNYTLRLACERGHLEVAQWLHATFALTTDDARECDNHAFLNACENGHIAVAQWLHATFELTATDARSFNNLALRAACENGRLELAQWLHAAFALTVTDARSLNNWALRSACKFGHIEVVQWLHATFALTADDVRGSGGTDEYAALCASYSPEIFDILFRILELEEHEPVGLDAATQAKYEEARERMRSARLAMQSQIKPAAS